MLKSLLCQGCFGTRVTPGVRDGGGGKNGEANAIRHDEFSKHMEKGRALRNTGKMKLAIEHFNRCIEISRLREKSCFQIAALSELGTSFYDMDDFKMALSYFTDMHECAKSSMDQIGIITAAYDLASAFEMLEENDKAIEKYKENIIICEESGNLSKSVSSNYDLGKLYRKLGRSEEAKECLRKAWEIASSEQSDLELEFLISSDLGDLSDSMGHDEDALHYRKEALGAVKRLNATEEMLKLNNVLGESYFSMERYATAEPFYNECLRIAKGIGDNIKVAESHERLGLLYEKMMEKEKDSKFHKDQAASLREQGNN